MRDARGIDDRFRIGPVRTRPRLLAALGVLVLTGATSCGDDDPPPEAAPTTTTTEAEAPSTTQAPPSSAEETTTEPAESRFDANARLRLDGIGPVKVGMTTAEATRAAGTAIELDPNAGPDPSICGFATSEEGPDVSFMVIDGVIQRVDVSPPSRVVTVSGVGVGATEAEVLGVYQGGVRVEPHPYVPEGHYLVYESSSQGGFLLIFETDGAEVTSFRAGERSAAELIEGCA